MALDTVQSLLEALQAMPEAQRRECRVFIRDPAGDSWRILEVWTSKPHTLHIELEKGRTILGRGLI